MTVRKRFFVALDIKRPTSNRDFEVVEGDNGNVLEVTLTDEGSAVDLTGCRVLAVFSKSDGRTAEQDNMGNGITLCDAGAGRLTIDLFTGSFAPGLVECEIQVYSGEAFEVLATSAKFNFMCRRGIANSETIPAISEWPMLVAMLEQAENAQETLRTLNDETIAATADAMHAATDAQEATEKANTAAAVASSTNAAAAAAETVRAQAEAERSGAEATRATAEDARRVAETARNSAEDTRAANEAARSIAEAARAEQETVRIAQEAVRVQQSVAMDVFEAYAPGRTYVPHNKVSHLGSSYVCVSKTTGNAPPNSAYWLLIAARGADGTGSGNMQKSVYDTNNTGVVDNASALGGRPAAAVHAAIAAAAHTAAGKANPSFAGTATLPLENWAGENAPYTQTLPASGINANSNIVVSPAPASFLAYGEAGIRCTGQSAETLSFAAENMPNGA
ncbi:BppU family phage baseplate upper protein, partial [Christensenellaceae bacterium OttesenSCG-928-L17]|nr:BppU family phage baseplate upper protein [Christensenellaceae bacterium OttesenSCG-928-L17]